MFSARDQIKSIALRFAHAQRRCLTAAGVRWGRRNWSCTRYTGTTRAKGPPTWRMEIPWRWMMWSQSRTATRMAPNKCRLDAACRWGSSIYSLFSATFFCFFVWFLSLVLYTVASLLCLVEVDSLTMHACGFGLRIKYLRVICDMMMAKSFFLHNSSSLRLWNLSNGNKLYKLLICSYCSCFKWKLTCASQQIFFVCLFVFLVGFT